MRSQMVIPVKTTDDEGTVCTVLFILLWVMAIRDTIGIAGSYLFTMFMMVTYGYFGSNRIEKIATSTLISTILTAFFAGR